MTNRKSLKLLKDMIDRIDDVYLLNKLGIVITKGTKRTQLYSILY